MRHSRNFREISIGRAAIGANTLGALALGAFGLGVLAIGRLIVGRLTAGKTHLKSLSIGDPVIDRLRADEITSPASLNQSGGSLLGHTEY